MGSHVVFLFAFSKRSYTSTKVLFLIDVQRSKIIGIKKVNRNNVSVTSRMSCQFGVLIDQSQCEFGVLVTELFCLRAKDELKRVSNRNQRSSFVHNKI